MFAAQLLCINDIEIDKYVGLYEVNIKGKISYCFEDG